MKAHVLTGSRSEIAARLALVGGEVREAIVFVDEPSISTPDSVGEDIFAEMEQFEATAGGADYSRQTIYARMEGE